MSLSLLRSGQLAAMTTLTERLAYLPQLAEVLANSPSYGAVYAGYEDGDFFLVRKLTERARAQLGAYGCQYPAGAEPQPGQGRISLFRSTADPARAPPHAELPLRSPQPRLVQAGPLALGIATTSPYLFFTTKEPGMTLAVESDDRRAVIGLDTSVEGLSALIGKLQLPAQSQVILFDEYATLLAADPRHLPSFEQLSQLPMLATLPHPALPDLQQRIISQPTLLSEPVELNLTATDGSDWLVNLAPSGPTPPSTSPCWSRTTSSISRPGTKPWSTWAGHWRACCCCCR